MKTPSSLQQALGAAFLAGSVAASPAAAFEINFDLTDGTVVDTEYSPFLNVSAKNNSGSGPDLAVVYNPAPPPERDPDLEQPFATESAYQWDEVSTYGLPYTGSNNLFTLDDAAFQTQTGQSKSQVQNELELPADNGRKILVVQENSTGCDDGVCDFPDDEGGGPNFLVFDFAQAVTLDSLDLFDLDPSQSESARIAFFYEGHSALGLTPDDSWIVTNLDDKVDDDPSKGAFFHIDGGAVGADSAARFYFGDGVENVRRMVVAFSSSGAVTGLRGSGGGLVPPGSIPEPGTMALLGAAFLGLVATRRRRSVD
jgi:hypothetical protein